MDIDGVRGAPRAVRVSIKTAVEFILDLQRREEIADPDLRIAARPAHKERGEWYDLRTVTVAAEQVREQEA